MKKNSFLMLSFMFFCLSVLAQSTPPAAQILKEAYQQANKENKKVIVIFHASWCVWCHKMDSSINSKSCKALFDKYYIIRHLTVDETKGKEALENPGAKEMQVKYGGGNQGIPFWLVFDSKGTLLADSQIKPGVNSGCPANKEEVDYFISVLKKTSGLTDSQLKTIHDRFRQNDVN